MISETNAKRREELYVVDLLAILATATSLRIPGVGIDLLRKARRPHQEHGAA
jgi:hypothetical protein